MSLARDRYNHHFKQFPMWGDNREWIDWRYKQDRLYAEMVKNPEEIAETKALLLRQQKKVDADKIEFVDNCNKPGFNEYGLPLHACNGYRHDEHWWAWLGHNVRSKQHIDADDTANSTADASPGNGGRPANDGSGRVDLLDEAQP